ncbi:Uncharacterised protein [Vibrio cholerae]|nr:Uncharacterised protein [Vibrio cholerae]
MRNKLRRPIWLGCECAECSADAQSLRSLCVHRAS